MIIFVEKQVKNKYVFIRLGENGVIISFSDDLNEFKNFNHYGFSPDLEDLEMLRKNGVVGWTGNDVWYYIMQHDTWRYMNLDLQINIVKSTMQELTKEIENRRLVSKS